MKHLLLLISLLCLAACAKHAPQPLGPNFYAVAGQAQQIELILNSPASYVTSGNIPAGANFVVIGGNLYLAVPANSQAGTYQFAVSWNSN
jgi:hypothetical protein